MKIKNQYNVFSDIEPIIELKGNDAKKLVKVLRLIEGSYFKAIDSLGNEGIYKIEKIIDKKVVGRLVEKKSLNKEKKIKIVTGITKRNSIEILIRFITQIGKTDIILVPTEYSLKPDDNEIKKIIERLKRISIESLKQSESVLPDIKYIEKLEKIEYNNDCLYILLDREGEKRLIDIKDEINSKKVMIFLGPEGDFSEKEKEYLLNALSCKRIKLSENILRTETAGIVAVSQLLLLV